MCKLLSWCTICGFMCLFIFICKLRKKGEQKEWKNGLSSIWLRRTNTSIARDGKNTHFVYFTENHTFLPNNMQICVLCVRCLFSSNRRWWFFTADKIIIVCAWSVCIQILSKFVAKCSSKRHQGDLTCKQSIFSSSVVAPECLTLKTNNFIFCCPVSCHKNDRSDTESSSEAEWRKMNELKTGHQTLARDKIFIFHLLHTHAHTSKSWIILFLLWRKFIHLFGSFGQTHPLLWT